MKITAAGVGLGWGWHSIHSVGGCSLRCLCSFEANGTAVGGALCKATANCPSKSYRKPIFSLSVNAGWVTLFQGKGLYKENKLNNCSVVWFREWANPVLAPTARFPPTAPSPTILPSIASITEGFLSACLQQALTEAALTSPAPCPYLAQRPLHPALSKGHCSLAGCWFP